MNRILKFLIISLVICGAVAPSAYASDPRKHLEVKIWPEGTVVFVKPTKMSRMANSTAVKDMEYDIALNTQTDTVIITSTVITEGAIPLDFVQIGDVGRYPVEKIYTEPISRNHWRNRLSIAIPLAEFRIFTELDEAPTVCFEGAGFRHTNKKWEDCRRTYLLALEIIKHNKKE